MLALVLVPHIGMKVGGARRWLGLGPMRFQPSELGKLALIVWLAHWLAKEKRRLNKFGRGFAVPMGVVGCVLVLVLAEPDFGSTALLASVSFALMFIAGVRLRFLIPTIFTGAGGFVALMIHNPERSRRLMAFLDLEKYKQGAGYQVWQAILAFGSGGFNGLGLGNSRQKMFYLPEAHTDFILPVVGEELGLRVTLLIVFGFVLIIMCGSIIAMRARDRFGMLLGFGIVVLLAIQAAVNIGVTTMVLPNKGFPLPFISYGGSNLVFCLLGVGILINIYRHGLTEKEEKARTTLPARVKNRRMLCRL
ncbi:MAG TPA: FtsW/RodA/SpoVE family cell cycle protein [Chthoniobacteraceae bacterium]|nr:FtsW/RodA/SpoVE family cell cycle protein [Chthoniobacteraceae bacterium]